MCNLLGGDDSQKSVSSSHLSPWLDQAAQGAVSTAQGIASTPWTPYSGERVAGLSDNQSGAVSTAANATGNWQPAVANANSNIAAGGQALNMSYTPTDAHTFTWDDAAMQKYMNPFVKGALDPVLQDQEERAARSDNARRATSAMHGAFGGSRMAVEDTLSDYYTKRLGSETLAKGYNDAYNNAFGAFTSDESRRLAAEQANERERLSSFQTNASLAAGDRDAAARAGDQWMKSGALTSDLSNADVQRLMTTGALDRGVAQQRDDVAYQQFQEQRDWPVRNLNVLLSALSGTPHDTTTTTKTSGAGGSDLASLLGAGIAAYGAFA